MAAFKITLLFVLLAVQLLAFQNCSSPKSFLNQTPQLASNSPETSDNNGQPYDGKIYIVGGNCLDGTLVRSRLVLKSQTEASLVRDNCQTITPVTLSADDFQIKSTEEVTYQNQSFVPELPKVPVSLVTSWVYQLTGTLKMESVKLYAIDLFSYSASTIQSLKASGHTVICNFSAGAYEPGRPDSGSFQASDIGNSLGGGSQARWLDNRSSSVRSLMLARLDLAKSKGCDGVDMDSVDAFYYNTGFPLTIDTQFDYNQFLAFAAHDRHLVAALNNTPDLVLPLVDVFDFSITQECYALGNCSRFLPFISKGKAVFNVEYGAYSAAQCSDAKEKQISLLYANPGLDGSRFEPCL